MKTIKINFVGFWNGFKPEDQLIYRILTKNYNVCISENPDYIICSCFNTPYEYCNYKQIRIMLIGENYIPDFNFVDYAITPYPISFFDRSFYLPHCIDIRGNALSLQTKNRNYDCELLKEKKYFTNFIFSHDSESGDRSRFFELLSKYKRIESAGSYLNNMEGGYSVKRNGEEKTDFQRKTKFSICFESTVHDGFITEKITDAFYADTIPIYSGSKTIKEIFNPSAFIDVSDFEDFDAVIEYVKYIDNNDSLYLKMLREPIFIENNFVSKKTEELELFLRNIFDQPLNNARRRSVVYAPKKHEEYILELKKRDINTIKTSEIPKIFFERLCSSIIKKHL